MIIITSVDNENINFTYQIDNSSHSVTLSSAVRNNEIGIGLDVTWQNHTDTFMIWNPSVESQQLWLSYMKNVMSLGDIQTEATNRSISTAGKTQEQLAKDVIQYECVAHNFPYLIVDGMSVNAESIEVKTKKTKKKK